MPNCLGCNEEKELGELITQAGKKRDINLCGTCWGKFEGGFMAGENDIRKGKGYGFTTEEGIYMVRCFECGKENYAPAVATGRCAWCGHDANKESRVGSEP